MSSRDRATAALIAQVAAIGDGAVIGTALALFAAGSWIRYLASSAALCRIKDAPFLQISDLRCALNPSDCKEKLVVVRGSVLPKASAELGSGTQGGALVSQGTGESAVVVQQVQSCAYSKWKGFFGWRIYLNAILESSWMEQKSSSLRLVPFILVEGSHQPNSVHIDVSLDNSTHPLPLTTVYHQLHPVQPTTYTFFQIIFGYRYPVALLDEENILPVGKEVTAVGICRTCEGDLEIRSCAELPCFLSDKTKDEIEMDLAVNAQCLFWSGIVLGTLSIGILGYAIVRNWWKWKEWRQRRRQDRELLNELQVQDISDEVSRDAAESGDIPDEQMCVICFMRRRRSAFIPCGHLVCCPRCAISVELDSSPKCPVCRQSIRSSIRVYDS